MARISKQLSETKQAFVIGLFTTNPNLTIREIQEKLKVQFAGQKGGETMNPATVLNLRNGVRNPTQQSPIVPGVMPETEATFSAPVTVEASTETIVEPTPTTTIGDLVSPNYSAITDTDPTPPSPVVQAAPREPAVAVVPVEGETYTVEAGYVQVTDADGRVSIRKGTVTTPDQNFVPTGIKGISEAK